MRKINIKKVTILGTVFISWLFLSFIFIYSKSNITVISKAESQKVLTKTKYTELLKGEKIAGKLTASENYLGQISVRFYNFDRINKDEVNFRLYSGSALIYEHVYKTDQFLPNGLFPFGFLTIPDSRGKEYKFEIESVAGKPEDGVTLSLESPLVTTSYQYPKKLLLKSPGLALDFLTKKISYTSYDRDFLFSSVEYLIFISLSLLIIYLFIEELIKFKIRKKRIGDMLLVIGLILISFSAIIYYLKQYNLSESISIWGYFLLVLGTVFVLIKTKFNKTSKDL